MFIHCMENTFLEGEDRILTFRTRFMFLLGFSSITHKGIKKFVTNSSSSQYKGGGNDYSMDSFFKVHNFLMLNHAEFCLNSALDLFGGNGVRYADCVEWNRMYSR